VQQCLKETFWRGGGCFGSARRHEDITKNRVVRVASACCECPSPRRLNKDSKHRCGFTSSLGVFVQVGSTCCTGEHFQTRGNRERHVEEDPVAEEYEDVVGKGYFSTSRELLARDGLELPQPLCVTASKVNVRSGPGPSNQIVSTLSQGQRVTPAGASNGWTQTSDGWVYSQFLGKCAGSNSAPRAPPVAPATPVSSAPVSSRPVSSGPGASNGICPKFYEVWNGYPSQHDTPSDQLLPAIGFGTWITNTCAIRTSMGLRAAGWSPGDIGRTKWVAKGKRYLIRVAEMAPFLTALTGVGYVQGGLGTPTDKTDAEGNVVYGPPPQFVGKAGVIHFSDCGWTDATGHFDVWDGANIRSHAYFDKCKSVELFNICTAKANADYAPFIAYLQRTNAR